MTTRAQLIAAAKAARLRAHDAYSDFKVGAAVETADGRIFSGCNIENSTYGLTLCAERVAIFKAVSEGYRKLARIAVVTDTNELTPPCGACRQIIWEFCGDVEIILANLKGKTRSYRTSILFPKPFDRRFL
jgi:cytidine deaminase